jgi:membrane protein insertase Oxa1/YidC/SpoIIIJ
MSNKLILLLLLPNSIQAILAWYINHNEENRVIVLAIMIIILLISSLIALFNKAYYIIFAHLIPILIIIPIIWRSLGDISLVLTIVCFITFFGLSWLHSNRQEPKKSNLH